MRLEGLEKRKLVKHLAVKSGSQRELKFIATTRGRTLTIRLAVATARIIVVLNHKVLGLTRGLVRRARKNTLGNISMMLLLTDNPGDLTTLTPRIRVN